MADDDRDKWHRLPKISFDKRALTKRMRKVEGATTRHAHKFIIKRWSSVREVQRHVVTWVIVMGLLIAATGLQLMWYQQSYRINAPANDGTYAEAVLGSIDTLNPLFANTSAEQSASYLMFSRLLRYDKTGHINYDLATDIKINDTNTVYTVSIRPDAKWHDGTSLTANDIAFTISLIKNPNVRSTITGWDDIVVKVINDTTIEFTLKATYAAFEHALTFPIVPKHILGSVAPSDIRGNSYSWKPIGSGPFKINDMGVQNVDTTSGRKVISMIRNEDYYGGTAKLARFQLHNYDTTDAIVHALALNEVNAAADLSPADIGQVDSKRYIVSSKPIQSGTYAIINTRSELLSDVVLRRALQLSTNTQAIRDKLPAGTLALDLPFTNGQLTGDVPKALPYDLVSAKKLLDDDGWKLNAQNIREKDGKQLKLSVITMKDSEFESVLEIIARQWRTLGIMIETQVVNPTDVKQNIVQNILQPRNFDVLLYQLNIGADPDVYAYWHSSQISSQGLNFSNYSNAISDDALASARARVEPALRNAKYITFAKQWLADVPAIGLYQSTAQYASSNNVHSSDKSTVLISPVDRYSDVLDWSVGSRSVYKTP
jgi:peptide/nickel transport system substrate-binding protein